MEVGPWYDRFASIYDASVERVYAPYRPVIAESLALAAGGVVVDVACGTGPNLPHLSRAVGPAGRVVGVDLSAGMLRRAAAATASLGNVELVERDVQEWKPEFPIDGALSTLGVSVIPVWESILDRMWALLRPGGRLVVFDIHAESFVPQSYVVRFMAGADLQRRPWRHLEARGIPHELRWLDGSPHVHGGRPFLLTATR